MSTPLLEATGLVCGYGERDVLRGVDLTLQRGEFLGIIGPNGCGKSTLLAALTGWLSLRQGTVRLQGQSLTAYAQQELARQIAVVPQASVPAFAFTVREAVAMGRYPHLGRSPCRRRQIARWSMERWRSPTLPICATARWIS